MPFDASQQHGPGRERIHQQLRPFIGVHFTCANRYVRVYRDINAPRYLARCPACGKTMRFIVAPGGSEQRVFSASC